MGGAIRRAVLLAAVLLAAPSAVATHDDGYYDQERTNQWDTADVDVLVEPPRRGQVTCPLPEDNDVADWATCTATSVDPGEADPTNNTYLRAVQDAIDVWDAAIEAFGPTWLKEELAIDVYVLGFDVPPPEAVQDPEIVVTHEVGFFATNQEQEPLGDYCWAASNSAGGVWSYGQVYNVTAHEYGHCLGVHHTGAPEGGAGGSITHPQWDVMSYGEQPHVRDCVSNLNVEGLTNVFGPVLDKPSNDTATVAVEDYTQVDCNDLVEGDLVLVGNGTDPRPVPAGAANRTAPAGDGSTPPSSPGSTTIPGPAVAVVAIVLVAVAVRRSS